MTPPLVTVVIPYYGAADWVERALRSALGQEYPEVEVVLVNDGSPDTLRLLACIERLHDHPHRDRLRLIHQDNAGPSAARNRGIEAARGRHVAFLDADDYWVPTLLTRAVDALEGAPSADLVYFDGFATAVNGERWRISARSPSAEHPGLEDLLGGTSTVITSGTVVRRDLLLAAGGFDERLRRSEDFDLWLRLLRRGARFRWIPAPLVERRLAEGGLSASRAAMHAAIRAVLARHLADPDLPKAAVRAGRRHDAAVAQREAISDATSSLLAGRSNTARRALWRAFRQGPSAKLLASALALSVAPTAFTSWFRQRSAKQP